MFKKEEIVKKVDATVQSLKKFVVNPDLTNIQIRKAQDTISSLLKAKENVLSDPRDGINLGECERLGLVIPYQYWCAEGHFVDKPPCKVHPSAHVEPMCVKPM